MNIFDFRKSLKHKTGSTASLHSNAENHWMNTKYSIIICSASEVENDCLAFFIAF